MHKLSIMIQLFIEDNDILNGREEIYLTLSFCIYLPKCS